jgi:hypothetical protein
VHILILYYATEGTTKVFELFHRDFVLFLNLNMFIDPLYHYDQHSRQFCARKIKNNRKGNKKGQMKAISKMAGKKFHLGYTFKTKTRKKNKFRSNTVMVLQMFFF